MLNFFTAVATLLYSFSNSNSGVCTPIITKPLSLYFSYHALRYGVVRWQLIQLYVKKSTRITFLPIRPLIVIGFPSVFIKPSGVVISFANSYCFDFASAERYLLGMISFLTSVVGEDVVLFDSEGARGTIVTASFDPDLFTLFELMESIVPTRSTATAI